MFFSEKQQFRQPWLWAGLIAINGIFLYGIIQQSILGAPFGDNPAPTPLLAFFGLIPLGLALAFWFGSLETRVDKRGIYFRFMPMVNQARVIHWDEIASVKVREYKPLREFGGWGIRFAWKTTAYNVSGNMGIDITLKSGKHILLGTQKPEEATKAIQQFSTISKTA